MDPQYLKMKLNTIIVIHTSSSNMYIVQLYCIYLETCALRCNINKFFSGDMTLFSCLLVNYVTVYNLGNCEKVKTTKTLQNMSQPLSNVTLYNLGKPTKFQLSTQKLCNYLELSKIQYRIHLVISS